MESQAKVKRGPGRPAKSPEGNRITVHLSLSPRALKALRNLCNRPIEPISMAGMVEYLILEHEKGAGS